MRYTISIICSVLLFIFSTSAETRVCGGFHVTEVGESIFDIAEYYYNDGRKWTVIYYTNQETLRHNPSEIYPGIRLKIPCLDVPIQADPTPLQRQNAELKALTGGDYAPFTDQNLPGGGLITELVNAAFESSPSPVTFSVSWIDDWSQHLFPLLNGKQYDVGFPWLQPNCDDNREHKRCKHFHFSNPLFEMLVLLFVRHDDPIAFSSDRDIEGATLCRPKGYYTHDLDRKDRRWLSENKINLMQPDTLADCFHQLVDGRVDAVAVNEFTGHLKIQELGLSNYIVALERPISIETLHVLISKTHPRGTTFLYRFNAGLQELKKSQRYNKIIERHLSAYWQKIKEI